VRKIRSLRASNLLLECVRLLNSEINKPTREVSDEMLGTVIHMAKCDVSENIHFNILPLLVRRNF
jgi:hypothetical protein